MQLACFDLDGTITRHDTLVPYVLGFLRTRPWRLAGTVAAVPTAVRFAAGRADHGAMKEAFIRSTLAGFGRCELEAWTQRFVPGVLAHGVFADALAAIEAHRARGDRLVLLSASTELYVPAIGRALGFSQVVCTGLLWEGDRLCGRLATPNRRGEEKVRCFLQLRSASPGLPSVAYGNASSDLPHLKLADRGVLVNGSRRSRLTAAQLGIECASWR